MEVFAEIHQITYKPFLCKNLEYFDFEEIEKAMCKNSSFILRMDNKNAFAVSWWVSPKRTRSYPYARVYDTLGFTGKKITIIPLVKDEGKDGDRDFLQWDTISLMSLLGVYVIIGYYVSAEKNPKYENKITNQKFDIQYIKDKISQLLYYQSDALHWNLDQIDQIGEIARYALEYYKEISKKLGVEMHSMEFLEKRIEDLYREKEQFMILSRKSARKAQERESKTLQPKELIHGKKGMITIKNYLGGYYYFTCDEIEVHDNNIYLIESKYTKNQKLPSELDIKDGLVKMIVFTNLRNAMLEGKKYNVIPVLKLYTENEFKISSLSKSQQELLELLKKEAKHNRFNIKINNKEVGYDENF